MIRRWRYLAWFDVKRARLWQGVICAGVVLAFALIVGAILAAALSLSRIPQLRCR